MIRYFIGRSGTGKTHTIYQEISELCRRKQGEKGLLIVPEQFTLQAEMALAMEGGFAGFTVTSFRRLIEQVLDETGRPEGEKIEAVGQAILVKKAFEALQNKLVAFSKIHERAGFIALFSDFINELKQAGISPEMLMQSQLEVGQTTSAKLRDTSLVYAYVKALSQGIFYGEEEIYAYMAEAVLRSERLRNAHIWVDGFYFFNALEHEILKSFAKVSDSLTVSFTFEPTEAEQDDIFWAPYDAFTTLHQHMKAMEIKETKRHFEHLKVLKPEALAHMEQELFKYPAKIFEKEVSELALIQTESPLQEVLMSAGHIKRIVREENIQYADIAVVFPEGQGYEALIKRWYKHVDIPVFVDLKRQLTHSPLVTYLIAMLLFIGGNLKSEHLVRALKTGMTCLEKSKIDVLEKYINEKGIRAQKWHQAFKEEEAEQIRQFVLPICLDLQRQMAQKMPVNERLEILWEHICTSPLNVKARYEVLIQDLESVGDVEALHSAVSSWKGIVAVFEQFALVSGKDTMSLSTFCEVLATAFELKEVGGIPEEVDMVTVSSLSRFRSGQRPYVFVLGLNDGMIPSMPQGSGVFSDEEKRQLREQQLPLKSDSDLMAKNELYLIYQALTRGTKGVILSYALASSEGKPLRASVYADRLLEIFPKLDVTYKDQTTLLKELSDWHPNLLVSGVAEGLRRMVSGYPEDLFWKNRFALMAQSKRFKAEANQIAKSLFHENQPKPLSRQVSKKLYGVDIRASVTRLEQFNACPFSHFVRFGLRPKRERLFEVSLPDMGNLFHQSVEQFAIEALYKNGKTTSEMTSEVVDQMMDKIVERVVAKGDYEVFHSDARSAYMVNKLKRTGKRAAKLMLEHLNAGVFEPRAFEVAFGMGADQIPPICIELANGEKVYLEGRIDRIDVYDSGQTRYVKVIDYKSGYKKYQLADALNGLQIQLMVYMDAILSQASAFSLKDPVHPAGVFYFKIDDPMIQSEAADLETIEAAIRKELKMDGLVVGDRHVAAFMDEKLSEDGGKSDIIPFDLKKEGEPSKNASYLSNQHFEALMKLIRLNIHKVLEKMVAGEVKVSPYRCGKETACQRCDYKGLCQFDLSLKDNAYHNIHRLDREAIIEKLEEVMSSGKVDDSTE